MTAIIVSETSGRAEIAAAIAVMRERAKRYSLKDPRREAIDVEVDQLVDDWLAAKN